MKRVTTLLLLCSLLTIPRASAQLTITESDVRALIGETFTTESFDANAGQDAAIQALIDIEGASQTWDFTTLTFEAEGSAITVSYLDEAPDDAPGGNEAPFNTADFVQEVLGAELNNYSFQDIRDDGVYFIGFTSEDPSTGEETRFAYDPALRTTALPLTYETSWTTSTTYSIEAGGVTLTTEEVRDYEVDGYGTLVLPSGSVDALRLKQEVARTTSGVTSESTSYTFITADATSSASITVTDPGFGQPIIYSASYQTAGDTGGNNPPASAPAGLSPMDGATDVSTSPTLSWNAVSDATSYDVQVADDASFKRGATTQTIIIEETGITQTSYEATGLSGNTQYYWRVRGVNSDGAGPWSAAASFTTVTTTAVETLDEVPAAFRLHGNYPNPFNPSTEIRFSLPERAPVTLTVVDLRGRVVARLVDETLAAGSYRYTFTASNLPSGVYLYRLQAGSVEDTRAMTLLK